MIFNVDNNVKSTAMTQKKIEHQHNNIVNITFIPKMKVPLCMAMLYW